MKQIAVTKQGVEELYEAINAYLGPKYDDKALDPSTIMCCAMMLVKAAILVNSDESECKITGLFDKVTGEVLGDFVVTVKRVEQ